jgi:hypothetical protein
MKSTKLEGNLQPILGSLGQLFLTKINLLKPFDCEHLIKLIKILAKEKIISISFGIQLSIRVV